MFLSCVHETNCCIFHNAQIDIDNIDNNNNNTNDGLEPYIRPKKKVRIK